MSNTNLTNSQEANTMNASTVTTLRVAFNARNIGPFKGAHHSTIKAALKDEHTLALLADMYAEADMDAPAWLKRALQVHETAPVAEPEITAPVEIVSTNRKLIQGVKGTAADIYKPLLSGQPPREWVHQVAATQLENRHGQPYSALYAATMMANTAMSQFNRRLYGGYLVDLMTHEQFEDAATKVQDTISTAASAIAAHGRMNATTTGSVLMEVSVRVEEHAADARGHDELRDIKDELGFMQGRIRTLNGRAHPDDVKKVLELIERMHSLEGERAMGQGQTDNWDATDAPRPNDTGRITGAVETFEHLYSIPLQDFIGIEAECARALWSGKGLQLPALGRGEMEERLIEAYASAEGWADAKDRPALVAKIAKRAAFFEQGIEAKVPAKTKEGAEYMANLASYSKWAVNHFTRRIWRDCEVLALRAELYAEKLVNTLQRMQEEEDGTREPNLTRFNAGESKELGYTIKLPFLPEFGDEQLDPTGTDGERMVALYSMILDAIQDVMPLLRGMYKEYRALDEEHSTMWALFASEQIPVSSPPIYWNDKGWYHTEEEARRAFAVEMAEAIEKAKAVTAEAIAETLEAALLGSGAFI